MFTRSVAATFSAIATVALSSLLLVAAASSAVHAAELKLLGPVSLRVEIGRAHV